jgi:predicted small lipoprotein YifL
MKRMILSIFTLAVFFVLAACGVSQEAPTPPENTTLPPADQQETISAPIGSDVPEDTVPEDASPSATAETVVTLTVDGQTFSATLLDNESVRQLAEQFPLTLNMSELNGNEKYFYMDNELMSTDELAVMDGGKCILQVQGVRPFFSDKFDITKHPQYKYLLDSSKKNYFDIAKFLARRLAVKPDDVFECYEMEAPSSGDSPS